MSKHPNPRLAKIHRNYTVEEVAAVFGVHRNTVRMWIKQGLPVIDGKRPMLILGRELGAFLERRRTRHKHTCQPGEIYCVSCRRPKSPAGGMADYKPVTSDRGNLVGMCPNCDNLIYRLVSLQRLDHVRGNLDVTMPQGLRHISERIQSSLNSDFRQDESTHDFSQPS